MLVLEWGEEIKLTQINDPQVDPQRNTENKVEESHSNVKNPTKMTITTGVGNKSLGEMN